MSRLRAMSDSLRSNFFVLPAAAVVAAYAAGRLSADLDVGSWVGEATVDSARIVLSTVAAATITFASISFSVSLLIMQQGASLYSPRVIHGLVRDPFNRRVIAFVLATFTYSLVVLQHVRAPLAEGGEALIPQFAVGVALVLGVLAVLAVIGAIQHTSRQMDVSEILARIVGEIDRASSSHRAGTLEGTDDASEPDGTTQTVVRTRCGGWVRGIDHRGVLEALEPGTVARLEVDAGHYATRFAPICVVFTAPGTDLSEAAKRQIEAAFDVGATRTMTQDPSFGVRQLVDVALRALSPGINDPTTAHDAIVHLGTALVILLAEPEAPRAYLDDADRRLLTPHASSDEQLISLALDELRRAAIEPAVANYLLEMIASVIASAPSNVDDERLRPLRQQAALLVENAEDEGWTVAERQRVAATLEACFAARPEPDSER